MAADSLQDRIKADHDRYLAEKAAMHGPPVPAELREVWRLEELERRAAELELGVFRHPFDHASGPTCPCKGCRHRATLEPNRGGFLPVLEPPLTVKEVKAEWRRVKAERGTIGTRAERHAAIIAARGAKKVTPIRKPRPVAPAVEPVPIAADSGRVAELEAACAALRGQVAELELALAAVFSREWEAVG